MCGRFVEFSDIEHLKLYFPIDKVLCESTANYNVSPTQEILAVFRKEGLNFLDRLHWGLVPRWAKDISVGNKMINARAETVAIKPSFRNAYQKRRCLIPADGFYEWKRQENGDKQPFFISLPEGKPFAFAGLWEVRRDKEDPQNIYRSCTIITRGASGSVMEIHNRMPAVLSPDVYETWLNTDIRDSEALQKILTEKTVTDFSLRSVSKQVNSVRVNDPSNLE